VQLFRWEVSRRGHARSEQLLDERAIAIPQQLTFYSFVCQRLEWLVQSSRFRTDSGRLQTLATAVVLAMRFLVLGVFCFDGGLQSLFAVCLIIVSGGPLGVKVGGPVHKINLYM
jgi:hypothetical protein